MTLEQQVISLTQAKRLKELGIDQGIHLFGQIYWFIAGSFPVLAFNGSVDGVIMQGAINHPQHFYRSFNVAELGVMLGEKSRAIQYDDEFKMWFTHWDETFISRHDTEARAKAALLIFDLETNLIPAEEVNERLQNNK